MVSWMVTEENGTARKEVCVIAHANGGSRGPRKDRPVLLTVLHHRERRRWGVCVIAHADER